MRIIEGVDSYTYNVLIKGRELLFRENYAWGFVPELKSLGFEDKGGYYKRPCDQSEIEAAYCLKGTYTSYKGFEVRLFAFDEGRKIFRTDLERCNNCEQLVKNLGLKPTYDYNEKYWESMPMYKIEIPDAEIPNVWQIRKPVEGFPMLGEEKVYIKKDGVWLPRKEYGSMVDEE